MCAAAFFSDPGLAFTVFAPNDNAFNTAAKSLNLTVPQFINSDALVPILQNHLLAYPLTVRPFHPPQT